MFIKIGPEFQCLEGYGPEFECLQWKDKIRIRVFIKIGPGFQCFEGWGQNSSKCENSSVLLNKIITPMLFEIGPELNVWKGKIRLPMLKEIGRESKGFDG